MTTSYATPRRWRILGVLSCGLVVAAALLAGPPALAVAPPRWISRGPGGGGALFAPSFNPSAGAEMYVSSDMGDVFRTLDLAHWDMVDFRLLAGSRVSRVEFTSSPDVRYALSAVRSAPVPVTSTDGGASWHLLAVDPTAGNGYWLSADPSRTDRLLVSDRTRIYASHDAGASFATVYTDATGRGAYVAGAFWDGDNVYVGTNAGLLVSADGGASFRLSTVTGIPAGSAIASFAGARRGGVTRFFATTGAATSVAPGMLIESLYGTATGLFVLDLGQPAWRAAMTGIATVDHPALVATAGGDVDVAFAAGQSETWNYPVMYKTVDGGLHWTSIYLTSLNANIYTGWEGFHGDRDWGYGGGAVGLAVDRGDPLRVAYTDYGFVHLSTDGGATWRQAYLSLADQNAPGVASPKARSYHGAGLENTSWWGLTWSDPQNVFGSATDIRGARSTDAGASWSFNYTGHTLNTMYRAILHPNGKLYAATSSVHDLYQSTYLQDSRIQPTGATGSVLVSADKGATWQTLHNFGHPVVWVAADPTNPGRLYASVVHSTLGGIFVSNDIAAGASSTWTKLANPPRTEGHPYNIVVLDDGTVVASYSARRNSAGAFTASSGVFVLAPGATSWLDRTAAGMKYWTKDIVVDAHDSAQNTWYAGVFNGWGGPPNDLGGLYRTTDRGVTWQRIAALGSVESCAINPSDPHEMFVTTESDGLFHTDDLDSATPTFTADTAYPFSHPMRVQWNPYTSDEVWVTSFGGGVRVAYIAPEFGDRDLLDDADDCAPNDPDLWAAPGPARDVALSIEGGRLTVQWQPPDQPGTTGTLTYDVLRSASPVNFTSGTTAVVTGVATTSASEPVPPGTVFYLVRPRDACGWNLGTDSSGAPRVGMP